MDGMMNWKIIVALVLILTILNVASAYQIELVGKYTSSSVGRAIAVSGNYAYMFGDILQIIDISTLSSPKKIGQFNVSGADVAVSGNCAYVVGEHEILQVIDVSNPYNPQKIGQYNVTGDTIAISGNHAYVGDRDIGMIAILDISDPYKPTEVGMYPGPIRPAQIVALEDYVYIADNYIDGLVVIDVSDPNNPKKIGQINGCMSEGIAVFDRYAYLSGNCGFYVIDISTPSRPRIMGEFLAGYMDMHEVAVNGKYAYVSTEDVGWSVIDVSIPKNPKIIGNNAWGFYALDVAASPNYAFGVGDGGLVIFKVIETGTITISSSQTDVCIYIDGEYKGTQETWTKFFSVPVGYHTIKLTKYGYNDWENTIYVHNDEDIHVSPTLASQATIIQTVPPTSTIVPTTPPTPATPPAPTIPQVDSKPSASVQLHGEKTDVLVGEDIVFKLSAVNKITKPVMTVQVILIPPSGMSVTSSEFATSGAGQYTTTYKLDPGAGKDIEVRIKTNQQGDFNVKGEIVYYYGDNKSTAEELTLNLPIKVKETPKTTAPTPQSPTISFWSSLLIIGISYSLIKRDLNR
jgi:hypothetical protein